MCSPFIQLKRLIVEEHCLYFIEEKGLVVQPERLKIQKRQQLAASLLH